VVRLKDLMPLLHDIMTVDQYAEVDASEGEVAFRVHVPSVPEDLQKLWREFLTNYATALKSRHDLPIAVEDRVGWVEVRVRTV